MDRNYQDRKKTYSRLKFGRRASCFLALGFLALGFLTTGFFALNLQAQDAEDPRKKGFFVGIAPYTMGVTLEKEVKIAEVNDVVIDSVEYDATFGPNLAEAFRTNNNFWIAARVFVIALCKGNYTLIESPTGTLANGATGDVFIPITEDLQGFEHGVRGLLGILNIRQFIAGGDIDFDNFLMKQETYLLRLKHKEELMLHCARTTLIANLLLAIL